MSLGTFIFVLQAHQKIKSGAAAYSGTGIDQLSFTSTKQSDEKSENREIGGDAKSLKQKLEENIITVCIRHFGSFYCLK